jgi:threonine/homoserine/homoserine lactone efflux protein
VPPFLIAVIPSAGVLFLFWLAIRAILEADRRERSAQARIEAAERRENASGPSDRPAAG